VLAQLFKDSDQPCRGDRGIDLDVQDLAIEVVDDVEGAEAPLAGLRIGHEVRRPDRVWQARYRGQALEGTFRRIRFAYSRDNHAQHDLRHMGDVSIGYDNAVIVGIRVHVDASPKHPELSYEMLAALEVLFVDLLVDVQYERRNTMGDLAALVAKVN
jgi:hypothetical protein